MMVMTAKVDLKKILLIIAAAAALILGAIVLMGGDSTAVRKQHEGTESVGCAEP